MTVSIAASGAAKEAIDRVVPELVRGLVASSIAAQDPALWGADAESEAAIRLGWTEAPAISRSLLPEIAALRASFLAQGVDRFVLCGMGGSSLAPEVIAATYGVPLTILDSTDPAQVADAIAELGRTAVVVSSKSGSTLETDSQKRAFEAAFEAAGIDPAGRVVVVTDPGSPLDAAAREAGYRVFNADPDVGGRYSALTAFGLVPAGLAGADIAELLDEAEAIQLELAVDLPSNPGLVLGAAIAGAAPRRDKLGIVSDGTHIVGFGAWVEQLIAESTGKLGTGILPVVLETDAPELALDLPDLQVVRLVGAFADTRVVAPGEIEIAGTLGAQFMVWEVATAVAGRLLGINPFDQPDVESAKVAARALIDELAPPPPGVPLAEAAGPLAELLARVPADGYLAVQAYLDRVDHPELERIRAVLAARIGRPVTFGWGPRFLHSTGQYHKGGPAIGAYLQLVGAEAVDVPIPGRPFTFGQVIRAQAAGDARVLAEHGRPVLTIEVPASDPAAVIPLAAG
ncbi:MAG: glucose-6-phosphate isomerase [Micrococcales bacterium 73-13]|nr:MAG: glucose-6-phosphate isomerase [Micrococcales bacterium 73-13]